MMVRTTKKMIPCLLIFCLILSAFPAISFSAKSERGLYINQPEDKSITDSEGNPILLYQESHALVIGISEYTNGWPDLPGVKKDVEAVKTALETLGFNVIVHMDLDKNGIDQAFADFISQYGQGPENRLLFYFAGHGHTVKTTYGEDLGYIVPADAPNPHHELAKFQSKAMEMQQVEIYAKRVQSKHAMFLFDACFSGSLFALSRAVPEVINYKTAKPVRQFITSGSADETVPDESIFRQQFARALQGEADRDKDGYVTGTELGEFLQTSVVNYSRNAQHPQYGKIRNPNLDKGDFVFLVPLEETGSVGEVAPAGPKPSDVTFSIYDIQWKARLEKMEQAFVDIDNFDQQNYSKELKIEAWTRFINAFTEEDIPDTTRDDELLSMAHTRVDYWNTSTVVPPPAPTPVSLVPPTLTPKPLAPVEKIVPPIVKKPKFYIRKVVITNNSGKVLKPNRDDIYKIKKGQIVTISLDVVSPPQYNIKFAWTASKGKIPPFVDTKTTSYMATKVGGDIVFVLVWDEKTGAELSKFPINISIVR